MNDFKVLVWLFPILFIFHDFEEIILMQQWIRKNRLYLSERFPKLSKRFLPHFDTITTSSFALGVAEEFVLISAISAVSFLMNRYSLWSGLFIAFTLHLVIHCIQTIIVRKYVPAVVTSIICLPACLYIIKFIVQSIPLTTVIIYSFAGFIIMVLNLLIVHKAIGLFGKYLARYEGLK